MHDPILVKILQTKQKLLCVHYYHLLINIQHNFITHVKAQTQKSGVVSILTGSGKDPNFSSKDDIEPPGTNSIKIFNESLSLTVPKYL